MKMSSISGSDDDLGVSEAKEAVVSPRKRKKRTNHGWGNKAKTQTKCESVAKNPCSEALKKLEKLANPFEELCHDQQKHFAVHMFYSCQTSWPCLPVKKVDIYKLVGTNMGLHWSTVQRWILEYEKNGFNQPSKWGKHSKIKTAFDNEEFR